MIKLVCREPLVLQRTPGNEAGIGLRDVASDQ